MPGTASGDDQSAMHQRYPACQHERPPIEACANAAKARSISDASRTGAGRSSRPNEGATAWIAPQLADPGVGGIADDRHTRHARLRFLEQLEQFPLMLYSNCMKPVVFPPGRAKLSDDSGADRIGDTSEHDRTVRVACCTMARSCARRQQDVRPERDQLGRVCARALGMPAPQRRSIRRLRPTAHPTPAAPARTPRHGPVPPDRPQRNS